jgi:hypothetical protein
MEISEDTLRAMVRDAIAKHGSGSAASALPMEPLRGHVSHARLTLVTGGDPDGRCLIEPTVNCNHCGYCQSLGH